MASGQKQINWEGVRSSSYSLDLANGFTATEMHVHGSADEPSWAEPRRGGGLRGRIAVGDSREAQPTQPHKALMSYLWFHRVPTLKSSPPERGRAAG